MMQIEILDNFPEAKEYLNVQNNKPPACKNKYDYNALGRKKIIKSF